MNSFKTCPVFRFAPSPNGRLHLGHAYSALLSYDQAQRAGGKFLLRIEDIDLPRCRDEFVDGILEDLRWLGLRWEEPVRRQSEHLDLYKQALARLEDMGVLYRCYASRSEIKDAVRGIANYPRDPDGSPLYPGLYRDKRSIEKNNQPFAMRINHVRALKLCKEKLGRRPTFQEIGSGPDGQSGVLPVVPESWGDVVIGRKDIGVSYHLAVVVDDGLQGVTHITRGHDLFASTHIHRILQVLLDLREPIYFHHRLIADGMGRKLSKSASDESLKALRKAGVSVEHIRSVL